MFANSTWFYPVVVPSELPVGLEHLDSNLCWCDPITELDDKTTTRTLSSSCLSFSSARSFERHEQSPSL